MRHPSKRFAGAALLIGIALAATPAQAHRLDGRISASGLDFIETQIPGYLPTRINPPPVTGTLFTCPGGRPVDMTQRDTDVDLTVHSLDLSIPAAGTARIAISFSASASGMVDLKNPYLCFGSATCSDQLSISNATAVVDFDVRVGADGRPSFTVRDVQAQAQPDDVSLTLGDCGALDDVLNFVIDWGKQYFIDTLVSQLRSVAQTHVAPMLGDVLAGFTSFESTVGLFDVTARLVDASIAADGLHIGADVDLYAPSALKTCVRRDPGEPDDRSGELPNFSAGPDTHVAVAFNLGVLDDVMYEGWRANPGCFTDQELRDAGYNVPIQVIGLLLPGFPTGTEFSMVVTYNEPPIVEGHHAQAAKLTMYMNDVHVDLTGTLPDGTSRTLHVELDGTTIARVNLDVAVNSLSLELLDVTLSRLDVGDQQNAAELGFDVVVMRQMLEQEVLPMVIKSWGKLPISGPVFNFADYYVMVRQLSSTPSHLLAKADLFRAPATDSNAPDTRITSMPSGALNPRTARLRYDGTDAEIPSELLQYRIIIDGNEQPLTHRRELAVGRAGETKTYNVSVAAVDLHGNRDASPVTAEITVDGIAPQVEIAGERSRETDETHVIINWTMSDDVTGNANLAPRMEVYRVADSADVLSAEHVGSVALSHGATEADIELDTGALYRVEIYVTDEAGNERGATVLVQVGQLKGEGGGCSASRRDGGTMAVLLLLTVLIAIRRWQ